MWFSVTFGKVLLSPDIEINARRLFSSSFSFFLSLSASTMFCSRTARSFFSLTSLSSFSMRLMSEFLDRCSRKRADASSITSIALSGKNLSVMYFTESSTAERIAPFVIRT